MEIAEENIDELEDRTVEIIKTETPIDCFTTEQILIPASLSVCMHVCTCMYVYDNACACVCAYSRKRIRLKINSMRLKISNTYILCQSTGKQYLRYFKSNK